MVLVPYSNPHQEAPLRVDSIHRAAAGSDAPISAVGGSRQIAATSARSSMFGSPTPLAAMYTRSISGTPNQTSSPNAAIPASINAYIFNGCICVRRRGNPMLPMHSPPMNVASSTPTEMVVEPMASCSIWYQTTS